jgi:hypothetical protein
MSDDRINSFLPPGLIAAAVTVHERLMACDMCISHFMNSQPNLEKVFPAVLQVTELSKRIKGHAQVLKDIPKYYVSREPNGPDLDCINNLVNNGKVMIACLEQLYMTINWLRISYERDIETSKRKR